jgi:hypothetical protein
MSTPTIGEYADFLTGAFEQPQKKANHQANVVRVGEILPHPNADKLELTYVNGYQVVLGKGSLKPGDLAVYIQPDSVVPQTAPFEFIWRDHVGIDGLVPEKRRRITVRRFRKEYSEGLLLPVGDFGYALDVHGRYVGIGYQTVAEGDDVSELIGVTHYVPEFDRENTKADTSAVPRRRYPKTARGWFYFLLRKLGLRWGANRLALDINLPAPTYDIDALKSVGSRRGFQYGEPVHVTEKIHGSNGRAVVIDGVLYVGSHYQWKKDGDNIWWNAVRAEDNAVTDWCFENPGCVLYFEVGPTQKGFRYGAGEKEVFVFAYDVYDTNTNTWDWPGNRGFTLLAPPVYAGPFSDDVLAYADGNTLVPGAGKQVREGIVISATTRRLKLKVVSNAFLEKDNA